MAQVARVALGEVAEIERAVVEPLDISVGEPCLSLEDLDPDIGSVQFTCQRESPKSSKFRFTHEHVLYGKLRPYLRKVARADTSGVCSTDILPIRPGKRLDRDYLFHFLRTPEFTAKATQSAVGVNLPRLSPSVLSTFDIPLPTLHEQRRIAEILDKADALRAKRSAALAQLDTLTQSIFLDMFGDQRASGWPLSTVAGVAAHCEGSIRTGPFGSQLLHGEFTAEGVAVLGIDNAVENEFRWGQRRFITEAKYKALARYTVRPGDVLVTIMGTCGRCAVVPDDIPLAINTKHLCCITLDASKCDPYYLHAYFLCHPIARRYLGEKAKGAIMAGLNMSIIKAMPIPLAPIGLQQLFRERLRAVKTVAKVQQACRCELDRLCASLQHRAFRGEL